MRIIWTLLFGFLAALSSNRVEAAGDRSPNSSQILEVFETDADKLARGAGGARAKIDTKGYRRADLIGNIYAGEFELAPATGLDNLRYFAQTVADLSDTCPKLQLESGKDLVIPFITAGGIDLFERYRSGSLTQSEILQGAWLAVAGLSTRGACTYNTARPDTYDSARDRCEAATRNRNATAVLPSIDAAQDVALFLGRHGCESAEARKLGRQLIAFATTSYTRVHFTERMPAPDSAEGKAFSAIFANCKRGSIDPTDHRWCGCYVRTLHTLGPSQKLLADLSRNPFVDGETYMNAVSRALPDGGAKLYQCDSVYRGHKSLREGRAPRPTACLTSESKGWDGTRTCRYRAAFGTFTMQAESCLPEITSEQWGYQEVDCAKRGAPASVTGGPRVWKTGIFTTIDYEQAVPAGFVPELPRDARRSAPIQVRMLAQATPGALKRMSLTQLTFAVLRPIPPPSAATSVDPAIDAIRAEGQLVLSCVYKTEKGEARTSHWFETVPRYIREGKLAPAAAPYFVRIQGVATTCSARRPLE